MAVDYGALLVSQLSSYWDAHLWPRLSGLTDEEYFWEPAVGCWSLRPDGDGGWTLDGYGARPPEPPPVTTLAWRIVHVATAMSTRSSTFFGSMSSDNSDMYDVRHWPAELPGSAASGLRFLSQEYRKWHDAIAGLDASSLEGPLGPRGAHFAEDPLAALIVHINREVMHHGGEICLLRDLYRAGVR
jgi:hypothetical protein